VQKLYCYVDESGQDTVAQQGREPIFVVAVVVLEKNRDELAALCEDYEKVSGKGKFKWGRAKREERLRYLRLIFADHRLRDSLRFTVFSDVKKKFDDATLAAIARAVLWKIPKRPYAANVYIDGLAKAHRADYRRTLRYLGVSMGEVRGVRKDENSALTRLADALAGFVRDGRDDSDEGTKTLLKRALENKELIEV